MAGAQGAVAMRIAASVASLVVVAAVAGAITVVNSQIGVPERSMVGIGRIRWIIGEGIGRMMRMMVGGR